MSKNAPKALIDLIDSRIQNNKTERVAKIIAVSEDRKIATVSFPNTKNTFEIYNKTNERLEEGDSVYVSSNDGSLTNGYVSTRFGESSWLVAGEDFEIGKGAVDGDNLAEDAIDSDHIKDGAISGDKIADFTVDNVKIGFAAIDTANIRDATITTAKITDAAITNAKIDNATITTAKIQDAAITNAKIENAAIDNAKIGIAAIDTANIKSAAITTACIGDAAITTTQIADGSITDAKINDLTANKITAGTLDAGKITVVDLDCASLTVGQINGIQIEDGAIGIAKLDAIVNDKIATSQATADGKNKIYYHGEPPTADDLKTNDTWFDTNDGYKIYNYDGIEWLPIAFGTNAIDDSAITGTKLSDGSVTGVKLIEGAVTAREIATGAIVADKIAANAVTANAIEAKAVTALHIETNTITADKLLLGDSTNYSTIDMIQYVPSDWDSWTGQAVAEVSSSDDGYITVRDISSEDLLFSLPYSSSMLSEAPADNSFGFSFDTKNSAIITKNITLSAYFFNDTKTFIEKIPIKTFLLKADNVLQKWDITTTFARALNAKYLCFGISMADDFTCAIKNIQIRKTLGSTFISDGAITTNKIVADAITGDKIAARSIIANKIASNQITAEEIAAGAITADEIAANAITASKIKAGEITTSHVNSAFGQTLNLGSNTTITLTAPQIIAAGAVTFTNLSTSGQTTINGANITTGTISASRLDLSGYATFSSLSTAGSTTINGANITTGTISAARINFTGALNGYSSGNTSGLSITSNGLIRIPSSADIDFSGGASQTYIGRVSQTYLQFYNQAGGGFKFVGGDVTVQDDLIVSSGYTFTAPNIPKTTTTASTKVTEIAHFSTYFNVSCNGSNYALTYPVSDKRLKKNIFPSNTNALNKISNAKIRSFDWILDGRKNNCGFIAQEVEQDVGKEYVLKVPQNDGGINYQINSYEFIPLLTKGIQELNAQLIQAQNEISILKAKSEYYDSAIHEMRLEIEKLKNGETT